MNTPSKTVRITGEPQRQYAHEILDRIAIGGRRDWEVVIRPHSRSRSSEQNSKCHALIKDIHEQAFRGYRFDCLKAVFVSQFAAAKDEMGEPLRHPGATTWDWKRECPVYVRPSTTDFSTGEAAEFIEFLYAEGSALDVQWSERAQSVYDEYREAQ